MKNPIIPAALALSVALLGVAGCSSSDDDDEPTPPTNGDGNGNGDGDGNGADPVIPMDDPGTVPMVIDRMGRPGVSTALIRTDEDENAYNANGFPSTWADEFTAPMAERVREIDGLDGIQGNALLDADTLTGLLVDDRLQINTSIPECDIYLALEIGLGGCGGRTLERDVINDTLRHLVSQDMPVSDLATMNDNPLPGAWPFLAEPVSSGEN